MVVGRERVTDVFPAHENEADRIAERVGFVGTLIQKIKSFAMECGADPNGFNKGVLQQRSRKCYGRLLWKFTGMGQRHKFRENIAMREFAIVRLEESYRLFVFRFSD